MAKKTEPKLTLNPKDKRVGGVAGGIAKYFNIDSAWVRVFAVIFIILSGIVPGLIIYGVFYILMKKEGDAKN